MNIHNLTLKNLSDLADYIFNNMKDQLSDDLLIMKPFDFEVLNSKKGIDFIVTVDAYFEAEVYTEEQTYYEPGCFEITGVAAIIHSIELTDEDSDIHLTREQVKYIEKLISKMRP